MTVTEYGVLTYPGDITSSPDVQPGTLLGVNEVGWPWEVLDAEVELLLVGGTHPDRVVTRVQVQTASVETLRAAALRMQADQPREPRHVRRQRQLGRR